jgi:hypothetical protein
MKFNNEHKKQIRKAFYDLRNVEDFIHLLNRIREYVFGDRIEPFNKSQLSLLTNNKSSLDLYYEFEIKKKNGSNRQIFAPHKELKYIQVCLNYILNAVYEVHEAATGFVPDRSIVDNAEKHVGKNFVFNVDLKDFFPSIDKARIKARLRYPPFNLSWEKNRYPIGALISDLCCHEMTVKRQDENGRWIELRKEVLPQGAPTSPFLSNIICQKLDYYLTAVAKRFDLSYSRYADDITFSSQHNLFHKNSEFIKEMRRVITSQNFVINKEKVRLQNFYVRQEVTGIVVNEKPNVRKKFVKQLRMWLYYWETYGYGKANYLFQKDYLKENGHHKKGEPNLIDVLSGKLDFLKMIKGENDSTYQKLDFRYKKLINNSNVYTG